jgi:hypothetical protein
MARVTCIFWVSVRSGNITLIIYSAPINETPASDAALAMRMMQLIAKARDG